MTPVTSTAQAVGQRIKTARLVAGRSQAELAAAIGVTGTAVSYWEAGRRALSITDLVVVARALDVEPAALLPSLADDPPAPAPRAPSRTPWRVGGSPGTAGRTLYSAGQGSSRGHLIGVMDQGVDAALVVAAVNTYNPCRGTGWVCETHAGAHAALGPTACESTVSMPCPWCVPTGDTPDDPPGTVTVATLGDP